MQQLGLDAQLLQHLVQSHKFLSPQRQSSKAGVLHANDLFVTAVCISSIRLLCPWCCWCHSRFIIRPKEVLPHLLRGVRTPL